MADADSNEVKMADEASCEQAGVASTASDTECGKVSGTTESDDPLPNVGVTDDDKMRCEASAVEKRVKAEETVKSVTTESNVAMECGKKHELKCVDTTSEIWELKRAACAEAVRAYSELKDEMACEDAAGEPQSEDSKRSLEKSGLSTDAEESTQVDALDQAPYSPDSGELADESNHSDSLSSTSSERARAEDVKPEPCPVAGILKPAILSFLPITNPKTEEKFGASAISKTSSENSDSIFIRSLFRENTKPKELASHGMVMDEPRELASHGMVMDEPRELASRGMVIDEPKELASHGMVIDDPKPDDSKHVPVQDEPHELTVMKEAEVELEGELSLKEKSATSVVLGFQSEQERSNVELPMEQDRSDAMSESTQSEAEEPCSHDGGKRRMESSDEAPCVSPLKRRNQKLEET